MKMDPRENLLRVYKELADWYERQRQPPMRDRFLVLAADAALLANRPDEAEELRLRLLKANPHHMLKPYASFVQAIKAPDVLTYVKDLRVNYPANVAEDLLRRLQTEDKRPTGPIATPASLAGFAASSAPVASGDLFLDSKEAQHDLAPTAPPGALGASYDLAPLRPDSRPQTLPLQGAVPTRPGSLVPPRREPVRSRIPMPAPLPLAAEPAPARTAAEPSAAGGSWLTVLLFLLVLASGAALAGFTFLRPYLPAQWLP
jgi:hypothetical protein